jgi:colicin import membrane protein
VKVNVVQGGLGLYHSGRSGKLAGAHGGGIEGCSDYALLEAQVHGTYDKSGKWLEYSHTVEVEQKPMSERKESSVLFSLRELQTIEEDRVSEEAAEVVRAEEAATNAVEAEAQRIRDEEESRRVAAETSERQAREAVEQRQREEQMRLEESERRARVEAQAVVEQQRMGKEMDLRIMEQKRKKPAWIIAAVVGVVLVLGLVFFLKAQSDAADKAEGDRKAVAAEVSRMKKGIAATELVIDKAQEDIDKAFADLEAAKDDESRDRAIAARNQAKTDLKNARDKRSAQQAAMAAQAKAKQVRKKKREKAEINKCAKSNDPLCGIN